MVLIKLHAAVLSKLELSQQKYNVTKSLYFHM